MEITLEKLLKGKSTKINEKDFLSTADYVKSFIDATSKLTSTYRIEAIPPRQLTTDGNNTDLTYNRVLIQAVLPNKVDKYNEILALTYALDVRKPWYKVYRAFYDNVTNQTFVFNPDWIIVNELKPLEPIEIDINVLLSWTNDFQVKLNTCKTETLSTKVESRCFRLGEWIEKCHFDYYNHEINGKVKWSPANIIKVYNSIYIDQNAEYYVGDKDSSVINTYQAFADIIAKDQKDIGNRFEKTILINRLLNIK